MEDHDLKIGKTYSSWAEFVDEFDNYQKRIGTVFVRRDCKKFGVDGEITDRFQNRYDVFECRQGKKRHASTAKKRLHQRSFKTGYETRLSLIKTSAWRFRSCSCHTTMT